jgi:hypothetical protein
LVSGFARWTINLSDSFGISDFDISGDDAHARAG